MSGMDFLTEGCVGWQANLPFVDIGGKAVAIYAQGFFTCALLVEGGGSARACAE
jgi:hypothetical protein